MKKNSVVLLLCLFYILVLANQQLGEEKSLFTSHVARSPLVKKAFSYIEENREKIIQEWIRLTEIPAPSGHEKNRAQYMKNRLQSLDLDEVFMDSFGNVIGIWKGTGNGKKIILSAHMDTVFQDVWEIKVRREGGVLKAPGIGDDTASLVNLVWTIQSLKEAGFRPFNTYYFMATVEEEVGLMGMRSFLNASKEKFDLLVALDGDLGKVHYGALGFGGGKVVFRGPGAHTMQSRDVPNPNLAVAKAILGISEIELLSEPLEKWTVLNIGMISGGKVRNAVSQESWFTIDLRSANQEELERVQNEIKRICWEVASKEGVQLEMNQSEDSRSYQIPRAKDSFLLKTVVDIIRYLQVRDIEVDPLGSTEANVGLEKRILSLNLGRTYGRYKHTLREEAEIDGLFLAMKSILLLVLSLK